MSLAESAYLISKPRARFAQVIAVLLSMAASVCCNESSMELVNGKRKYDDGNEITANGKCEQGFFTGTMMHRRQVQSNRGKSTRTTVLVQQYNDGMLNGVAREFLIPSMRLVASKVFCYGVESGVFQEWYDSGVPKEEKRYKGGSLEGVYKEWWEDSSIKRIGYYLQGNQVGPEHLWYSNGSIKAINQYFNGDKEGSQRSWNEAGQYLGEEYYCRGEPCKENDILEKKASGALFEESTAKIVEQLKHAAIDTAECKRATSAEERKSLHKLIAIREYPPMTCEMVFQK